MKLIERVGLVEELQIDSDGNILVFKRKLDLFYSLNHVAPTNTTNYLNISPVEGYTFSCLKIIQNFQRLTGTGDCAKYICKYIGKINEQSYVVV